MSEDSYREVSSQSWGSRLVSSLTGMLVGIVLVAVAVGLLWWNEGRAVNRARALEEGLGQVVSVAADRVDAANQGLLVHLSGHADTDESLTDPVFGVTEQAIKLRRSVEMYQWREHSQSETREKLGGGTETVTTYTYDRGWESSLISSSNFKKPGGHANPGRMPYEDWSQTANNVEVGAFRLSRDQLASLSNFNPVDLNDATPGLTLPAGAELSGSEIYLGQNPGAPEIGDARIQFAAVTPQDISLVAVQKGNSFVPYQASNGNEVSLLESGTYSAQEMFQKAQDSNRQLTWILRLVGVVAMFIGFTMLFGTLRVLAAVVPMFGRLVGGAIGLVAGILTATISLVTIALAWIFYRPLLGGGMLVLGLALLFGLKRAGKAKAPAAPDMPAAAGSPPPPPPPA
ncbi:TMEM43 family protein [Thiorhodovibrio frisius]|uniref:Uncharacterized protein n=1 Tax=Thiorhodovibrio frisius TaxID=631362 RepID=H8Z8F3_9GAMM|nr:TMEM43 family protein [Thiorhodovibrio frisius]EIC19358.1 Protein of unknown function (DUF1625) [Thiorhodovibrio frisius]WPL22343.1 hypothetical protein Thiofri_02503 [Thiorhodovibrio frisius]